jgi:signal transduction histidine kinase
MTISDNGVGFIHSETQKKVSKSNGVGLRSLQSRVNLFKGEIWVSSALQKGTSLTIFIPAEKD